MSFFKNLKRAFIVFSIEARALFFYLFFNFKFADMNDELKLEKFLYKFVFCVLHKYNPRLRARVMIYSI